MTIKPAIVSAEVNGEQEDWYFSCIIDGSLTLTGYRLYRRDKNGEWYIAERWYQDSLALSNMIELETVPLSDSVAKEAISKSSGLSFDKEVIVSRGARSVTVQATT